MKTSTKPVSVMHQLLVIADIVPIKRKDQSYEGECPCCSKTATLLYPGANCFACYKMEQAKETMDEVEFQREVFIRTAYGDDTFTNQWEMCNDRNYSNIAFEHNQISTNPDEVLTRYELELLSIGDADYEVTVDDAKYEETPEFDPKKPMFITDEQKATNLEYYSKKLLNAKSYGELAQVRKLVIGAQQRESGGFFFPKGQSAEFWKLYREEKETLLDQGRCARLEIEDLIAKVTRPSELRRLKSKIYDQKNIFMNTKRELWNQCDDKIALIEAAA
jgi:hypothetical protein